MSGVGGFFSRVGKKCKHDDDFYFSGKNYANCRNLPRNGAQKNRIEINLVY